MWATIHLFSWSLVILLTILAFSVQNNKISTVFQMIVRVFFLVLIASGLMMAKYGFGEHALLTVIKVLLGFGVVGMIEMMFSYRKQGKVSLTLIGVFVGVVIITIGFGFYLTGGYPILR